MTAPRCTAVRPSAVLALVSVLVAGVGAGLALADPPPGYYATVDQSSLAAMRQTLHDVIDGHVKIPYTSSSTDTWDVLELADEDALDSSRILDLYRNRSYLKQGGGNNFYNREHSWPNSYGFPDDNSGNKPYSDCHHLFLCDIGYNGARGSRVFADCTSGCSSYLTDEHQGLSGVNRTRDDSPVGIWETWDHRKGDVARAIFYMDLRYEGDWGSEPDLIVTDDTALIVASQTGQNEAVAYMGLLTTLLEWHAADPVDLKERHRNDVVFQYQQNRNPFIDHPEWVELIYGGGFAPAVDLTPAVPRIASVRPNPFNPATEVVFRLGEGAAVELNVYSLDGKPVRTLAEGWLAAGEHRRRWDGRDRQGRSTASGTYLLRLESGAGIDSVKLLLLK
jgi:endonuclease I